MTSSFPKRSRRRPSSRGSSLRRTGCHSSHGIEQLERRQLMAVDGAFQPLKSWDTDGLYDTGIQSLVPGAVNQVLPVPGTDQLLMLTGSQQSPAFKKIDSSGNDLGFAVSYSGSLAGLTPLDDGGFLMWGSLAATDVGWFSGGFDKAFNGGKTDGFVAQVGASGVVKWGTFVGDAGDDAVNGAAIVATASGGSRLIITGSTTSTGGFVQGGDTVFDATSTSTGGTGAAPSTNGFVMVLDPKDATDTRFQKHVWSSYLTPKDPRNLATISPVGAFEASSGEEVLVVKGAADKGDTVTLVVTTGTTTAGTGAGAGTTTPQQAFVAFKENPNSPGTFQFTAKKVASQPAVPDFAVRRGNKLFYLLGAGPNGEKDAVKVDTLNNVAPDPGKPGKRSIACSEYVVDSATGIVELQERWTVETTFSVRGMFVDPFHADDPSRDAIYLVGTAFDNTALPLGLRYGNYQKGYGDPLIAELGIDGSFKRYQYVSGNGVFPEKGINIGITPQSKTLLVFADRYQDPLPGKSITTPDSGRLYSYNLSTTWPKVEVRVAVAATQVVVTDGSSTATAQLGTDFGKAVVGGASLRRVFTVSNSGDRSLTLGTPTLPDGFRLADNAAFLQPIEPGQSASFEVEVATTAIGTFSGQISFTTNDPKANPFNFSVKAAVITPPPSTFSVAAVASSVLEGNAGTTTANFIVTLTPGNPLPTYPLTVRYAAQGVTATVGQDFVVTENTLTFNQGETTKPVTVTVNGDTSSEPDETFKLVLSSASQGIISSDAGEATVTIINDDAPPAPLAIGFVPATVRVTEGNSGTRMAELTVVLNRATTTDVSVQYATANLTATAGSDYAATSGMLVIPAGSTQGTIRIPVWGDTAPESDEVFTVALSAATAGVEINPAVANVTVANDDGAIPLPAVRISNPSVIEGNGGSPKLSFVISLAKAVSTATLLSAATVDGTAKAGKDYLAYSGTVTIPAGRLSATVTVNVIPNRTVDGNRNLSLRVASGSSVVASGVGTIRDDDRPTVSRSGQVSQFAIATAFASYAAPPASPSTAKKK